MRVSYLFLPLLYLVLGGFVTTVLLQRIALADDVSWIWIYLPLLLITVFVTVMGIVNVWIHYRTWNDDDQLVNQIYTGRRMAMLYIHCWLVVVAGLLIGLIFHLMHDYIPENIAPLFSNLRVAFYIIIALLTLMALMSIVKGENLAEVRLRQSQNENLLLRSQLNPHFLYNTLNNIDALIWIDQVKASAAVNSLSQLMRYFTYSSRQDYVPIGEELAHIEQLICLQRLRMPQSENLVFRVSVDNEKQPIAPLLFIPLIENCFKHCGSLSEPGAINISISQTNGVLEFRSSNNLPISETPHSKTNNKNSQHGLGLKVMRRRLQMLYPRRHSLDCGIHNDRYETHLVLNS